MVWNTEISLSSSKDECTVVYLDDGRLLCIGGTTTNSTSTTRAAVATCNVHDPETAISWSAVGSLAAARRSAPAAKIPSGKVVTFCGYSAAVALTSCEAFTPGVDTWASKTAAPAFLIGAVALSGAQAGQILGLGIGGVGSYVFTEASNSWGSAAASYPSFDADFSGILLSDGRVFVLGNIAGTATPCIYDPGTHSWSTGAVRPDNFWHAAVVELPSGEILVYGGTNGSAVTDLAHTYDPGGNSWSVISSPTGSDARRGSVAIAVENGKALVVGGTDQAFTATYSHAHLYDGGTDAWEDVGDKPAFSLYGAVVRTYSNSQAAIQPGQQNYIVTPRYQIYLVSGRPVTMFSQYISNQVTAYTEIPFVDEGEWEVRASLPVALDEHSLTKLADGRVLAAGGTSITGSGSKVGRAQCYIYDPEDDSWLQVASMNAARRMHSAVLLNDGSVFVMSGRTLTSHVASAEVYDPGADTWTARTFIPITNANEVILYVLTAGPNAGKVLAFPTIFNSSNLSYLYDPVADTWGDSATGASSFSRTSVMLADGRIIVVRTSSSAPFLYMYTPGTNSWASLSSPVPGKHPNTNYHLSTIAQLPSGKVLMYGGGNSASNHYARIYDPSDDSWEFGLPLTDREDSQFAVLESGSVLVTGGIDRNNVGDDTAAVYTEGSGWEFRPQWNSTRHRLNGRGPGCSQSWVILDSGEFLTVGGCAPGWVPSTAVEAYSIIPPPVIPPLVIETVMGRSLLLGEGGPRIVKLDSDPSVGGLDVAAGSLGLQIEGTTWMKSGASPTGWSQVGQDVLTFRFTLDYTSSEFYVPIPGGGLGTDQYAVELGQVTGGSLVGYQVPSASRTEEEFLVSLSQSVIAGTSFDVVIKLTGVEIEAD